MPRGVQHDRIDAPSPETVRHFHRRRNRSHREYRLGHGLSQLVTLRVFAELPEDQQL
jgi:hypothetical protein